MSNSSMWNLLRGSVWLTKQARVTYCSVVQKHFFKSQKIRKCEQHVEYVTGHFIFMMPVKEGDGCFMTNDEKQTLSSRIHSKVLRPSYSGLNHQILSALMF